MTTVSNLTVRFGKKILFENVSFQLNKPNRYGLVGANGAGKSTLMKILTRDIEPESGEIHHPASLRLGVLSQDHYRFEKERNIDVVMMGKPALWDVLQEKEQLLKEKVITDEIGHQLAEIEMVIADQDGYQAEGEIKELLSGLGIRENQHESPLNTLSGGYKLRVLLAQCLYSQPDFLLLDEPTNHLDLGSIQWLEEYLCQYQGMMLVISHDQHFLNRISTHIMDIDYETIRIYKGDYEHFLDAKLLEQTQKETEIERQEKKKEEIQQFIDRFKAKATKARQASSRAKQLDRIEDVVIKRSSRIAPSFAIDIQRPTGKVVYSLKGISKSFGEHQVLNNISFLVERGERIAVIGPNGIGKSTLIKIITGEIKPSKGEIEPGHEVIPGYFPQDHRESIPGDTTSYEWLYSFDPGQPIGVIRGLLGRVLITGDEVHKKTQLLSGGEAARLLTAKMMLLKP
ncbi:MAG: ATP-binding cassette domain-containing protein, partial [Deltaproteobacteria bacterium]|nr:ATP-binding cassette domain-containing protein [Deltaproteobacteria bacterium]